MSDDELKKAYDAFSEFEIEINSVVTYHLPQDEKLKGIFQQYQKMYPESNDPASYVRWDLLYTIAERWRNQS